MRTPGWPAFTQSNDSSPCAASGSWDSNWFAMARKRLQATLSSLLTEMTFHGEGGRSSLLWIGILLLVGLRSRWGCFCGGTLVFVVCGQSFVEYWYSHYAAPVVPLVLAVMAEAIRRVSLSRPRFWQSALVSPAALPLLTVCFALANYGGVAAVGLLRLAQHKNATPTGPRSKTDRAASRQEIITSLNERGGGHLVFVRYDKTYTLDGNWVYNNADLNTARVIFAHDFDEVKNQELIARQHSRSVWLCTLSRGKYELRPYQTPNEVTAGENARPLEAEKPR